MAPQKSTTDPKRKKPPIKFCSPQKRLPVPIIVYAFFEALRKREKDSFTHKACGFSYSIKNTSDGVQHKFRSYQGEDCATVFWDLLEADLRSFNLEKNQTVPVIMDKLCKLGGNFVVQSSMRKIVFFPSGSKVKQSYYFTVNLDGIKVKFVDSAKFLDESLGVLAGNLDDDKKHRIKQEFGKGRKFELMKTECLFPYKHIDGFERFADEGPPEKQGFFDELIDEPISDENFQKVLKIWQSFHCKTYSDYFNLHLKTNVSLLEDFFEYFREMCLDKYKLDPAHYCTLPAISWDAMLLHTNIQLEGLNDEEMADFIKSNLRGGLTQCCKRHVKANNKFCDYDKDKPSTFIVYLDANNLGGWAMTQHLPFNEFSWLPQEEINEIEKKIPTIPPDAPYGYILEVDLSYPQNLHKSHNDLPFCCERKKSLLLTTFEDKSKYVIHYRNLQQCLRNGLTLTRIHRVLKFRQTDWLKSYIEFNTQLRQEAGNEFEKKMYKFFNNAIYGKTIQTTGNDNKPLSAGFTILELSKLLMYDFHYDSMRRKYEGKINLCYMDTDSFIYEIHTEDFYNDLKTDSEFVQHFDTSDIAAKWKIPSINRKGLGKFKDECNGMIAREFFGIKSKMYYLNIDGEEMKKAAGIPKYVTLHHLEKEDYENCVLHGKSIVRPAFTTTVDDYNLTTKSSKKTISPKDEKRFILKDRTSTLAWGHQDIQIHQKQ